MPDEFRLDDAVAILERMPASLSALLEGLPETWVRATEGEGTWSPHEVVGHLINAERTNWMVRARHIIAGDVGPFQPFDRTTQFAERSLEELLATFADVRRENVAALRKMNVAAADLPRTGRHPELGEVTLGQLIATWVVHDFNHARQIVETMARVYTDAVGPWIAFLPIVQHD